MHSLGYLAPLGYKVLCWTCRPNDHDWSARMFAMTAASTNEAYHPKVTSPKNSGQHSSTPTFSAPSPSLLAWQYSSRLEPFSHPQSSACRQSCSWTDLEIWSLGNNLWKISFSASDWVSSKCLMFAALSLLLFSLEVTMVFLWFGWLQFDCCWRNNCGKAILPNSTAH